MKTTVHCIKHQRDLHALSTLYPVYCTVLSFEAWLHHEIITCYSLFCLYLLSKQSMMFIILSLTMYYSQTCYCGHSEIRTPL